MSKRAGAKVVEKRGSHAIYVSQPKAVADLIAEAAKNQQARINRSRGSPNRLPRALMGRSR
jgi:hypothetical protein